MGFSKAFVWGKEPLSVAAGNALQGGIVVLLSVSLVLCGIPLRASAQDEGGIAPDVSAEAQLTIGEQGGYLYGSRDVLGKLYEEHQFSSKKGGHGFAAEQANTFLDRARGLDAKVIGYDNAKNGADRMIRFKDGTTIYVQDKYYSTAKESIESAFKSESGTYRYCMDGKPMQLEVASDQYDEVVKLMENKIREGKVPGLEATDSVKAPELVRKGGLTYEQACKIAKPGNFESLRYDAATGVVSTGCVLGISFALDYAACILSGQDIGGALQTATSNAVLTGGSLFAAQVVTRQIARTGALESASKALIPSMEALEKRFGRDTVEALVKAAQGQAAGQTAKSLAGSAARILTSQPVFSLAFTVFLTAPDAFDYFQGRISAAQFAKDFGIAAAGVVGGVGGAVVGGALGGVSTAGAGISVGAVVGGFVGSAAGGLVGGLVADQIYAGDAQQMYGILNETYSVMAEEYLITEEEAESIAETLSNSLTDDVLKDMYSAENKEAYADAFERPIFEAQLASRPDVSDPSEAEIRTAALEAMQGIVFLH